MHRDLYRLGGHSKSFGQTKTSSSGEEERINIKPRIITVLRSVPYLSNLMRWSHGTTFILKRKMGTIGVSKIVIYTFGISSNTRYSTWYCLRVLSASTLRWGIRNDFFQIRIPL